MKNFLKKIFGWITKHKFYTIIAIIILGTGGYFGWKKFFPTAATVRYITTTVQKGVLATTISGTGQVSASNQVDIKTKSSGDVTYVGVQAGDTVKTGTLLVQLNANDALKSVRDAKDNLESAQLSLAKLKQPATDLEILQSENSLAQAQQTKQQSQNELIKAYDDGFNTVTNAFLDLPSVMSGLQELLYNTDFPSTNFWNLDWYVSQGIANENNYDKVMGYRDDVNNAYDKARTAYDTSFNDYKITSRVSSTSTINNLISETYEATKAISAAVKTTKNLVDFIQDLLIRNERNVPSLVITHQASLDTFTGNTNSHLTSLSSIKQSIINANYAITNADRAIAEKTASLAQLKAGVDPLDLRSQELSIKQKENALQDAQATLANYSACAPFDGVIAAITAEKGDTVSAGGSLGTLITKQRMVTIALNEVDIAKVKVGQKATLTFDAIDGLDITGEVVEVDTIGTVSQGVVSYNVKIAFDIQDERVKPGMSVSANIILSSKPNVLLVSSSAIKTQNGNSYVQIMVDGTPQQKTVVIGDSNDTQTEIVSGINEGDAVVTQTITTSGGGTAASTQTTSKNSSSGGPPDGNVFRALN